MSFCINFYSKMKANDRITLKHRIMRDAMLPNSLPFTNASVQNKSKSSTKLSL
jgi:hypothetical protein